MNNPSTSYASKATCLNSLEINKRCQVNKSKATKTVEIHALKTSFLQVFNNTKKLNSDYNKKACKLIIQNK